MPINKYKIDQTGPKSQLGGENEGLFKYTYHDLIAGTVKKEPNAATRKGEIKLTRSFIVKFNI